MGAFQASQSLVRRSADATLLGFIPFFVQHRTYGDPDHGIPPLVELCINNTAPVGGVFVGISIALGVGTLFAL